MTTTTTSLTQHINDPSDDDNQRHDRPHQSHRDKLLEARRREALSERGRQRSVLAHFAVNPTTRNVYERLLARFRKWLEDIHPQTQLDDLVTQTAMLDETVVEYFDHLYLDLQQPVSSGTAFLAALGDAYPAYTKLMKNATLPLSSRAIQGWRKLHPNGMRSPWPFPAVCGVAIEMHRRGAKDMAMATILAVDTYLRPGELSRLASKSVILPRPSLGPDYHHASLLVHPWSHGRASKTGQFDESILLDSPSRPWLSKAVVQLKSKAPARGPLLPFSYEAWVVMWQQCGQMLGLPRAPLYVLRHTGASDDYLRHARSLADIKRRGRWISDSSVRRYEKAAKTMAVMENWSPQLLTHLRKCEANIGNVLMGKTPALAPPPHLARK